MKNIKLFEEWTPFWKKNKDNDIAKGILKNLNNLKYEDLTFTIGRKYSNRISDKSFLFNIDGFEIKSVMDVYLFKIF